MYIDSKCIMNGIPAVPGLVVSVIVILQLREVAVTNRQMPEVVSPSDTELLIASNITSPTEKHKVYGYVYN